jgi:hypothetical protein
VGCCCQFLLCVCRPGTWSNALPGGNSSVTCNPCPGNRTSDPSATDPSQCCEWPLQDMQAAIQFRCRQQDMQLKDAYVQAA